jgi:hypothetical protein
MWLAAAQHSLLEIFAILSTKLTGFGQMPTGHWASLKGLRNRCLNRYNDQIRFFIYLIIFVCFWTWMDRIAPGAIWDSFLAWNDEIAPFEQWDNSQRAKKKNSQQQIWTAPSNNKKNTFSST